MYSNDVLDDAASENARVISASSAGPKSVARLVEGQPASSSARAGGA